MNSRDIRNARRAGVAEWRIAEAMAYRCPDGCCADVYFAVDFRLDEPEWRMNVGHESLCPQNVPNSIVGVARSA